MNNNNSISSQKDESQLQTLKIRIPEHLYRAFQRCVWIQVNQTGHSQLDIMEEVVLDFLKKHNC